MVDVEIAGRTLTADEVAAAQDALGRKFDEWDLNRQLRATAARYASGYAGDFGFMAAMHDAFASHGSLTPRQAVGVLNTMAAEARQAQAERTAPAASPPVMRAVSPGRYTVPLPTGTTGEAVAVTLRLVEPDWGTFAAGTTVAKIRRGDGPWKGFATVDPSGGVKFWAGASARSSRGQALLALLSADDPIAYGMAFATKTGKCWRCGKVLEVPASLHRGVGPICAKHLGLL